jgi:glycosidase
MPTRFPSQSKSPWKQGLLLLLLAGLLVSGCGQSQPIQPAATPQATETPNLSTVTPIPTPEPTDVPTAIPYETPGWFDNAVLYEIFVRSFADSNGDGIGDLNGITNRLDYLEELGVEVLWLMPIYPSPSYHGYDVSDFFEVNPDYGTIEDLQALVKAVHIRGMRIILDFVPSHLSNQNPLFQEAYRNPGAPNEEWFVFTNETNTLYAGFAGSDQMPRFNHFEPEVVDYLIEAALFWIDLDGDGDYTDGIDGFRVDNATFPPQEFFIELRQSLKAANPDTLLLGETWVTDPRSLSIYYQDQFDALFDFPLYSVAQGNQNSNNDGLLAGKSLPLLLKTTLEEETKRYPAEAQAVRFFSNHDTNRNATELGGSIDRQKLASSFLISLPGPKMIYYGEEIGMPGQKGTAPWWDAYRREPMDWYAAELGPDHATWFMEPDRWNQPNDGISVEEEDADPESLLNHWRRLLEIRASYPALDSGEMSFPSYSASNAYGWAIQRELDDQQVISLFNFSDEAIEITLDEAPGSSDMPIELISGEVLPPMTAGQDYSLTLAPASAMLVAP